MSDPVYGNHKYATRDLLFVDPEIIVVRFDLNLLRPYYKEILRLDTGDPVRMTASFIGGFSYVAEIVDEIRPVPEYNPKSESCPVWVTLQVPDNFYGDNVSKFRPYGGYKVDFALKPLPKLASKFLFGSI